MSDLVKRLRDFFKPMKAGANVIVAGPLITDEAAARIEALEAGLKPFADVVLKIRHDYEGNQDGENLLASESFIAFGPLGYDGADGGYFDLPSNALRHAASLLEEKQ